MSKNMNKKMNMKKHPKKNNNQVVPEYVKETPEARRRRVSSGVKFRPVVIDNKKRKLLEREKSLTKSDS